MTTFPSSPRLIKGALIAVGPTAPVPRVIAFQYNPDTLSRTLQAQTSGEGADRGEAMRLNGAPVETLRLEVEFDATDALERGDTNTLEMGLHPQLAALEMLIYPPSALVIVNSGLLAAGTIEIVGPEAPLTLLVWGPRRVLPVRLNEFSISEDAYDVNLNPVRAKVTLGLRVLSYNDLPLTSAGYYVFMAHQVAKETMAAMAVVNSFEAIGGGQIRLA